MTTTQTMEPVTTQTPCSTELAGPLIAPELEGRDPIPDGPSSGGYISDRDGTTARDPIQAGDEGGISAEAETYVTVDGREWRIHPLARIMPRMSEAEFERLKASIREAGRNFVPIITNRDLELVDGLHRLRACLDLGIEPYAVVCDDNDSLVDIVMDSNECRRRLDDSQRALVAAKLATLGRGRPDAKARIRAITQEEAAEKLGVSRTQVQAARTVLKRGSSGLIKLVEEGKLAVSVAACIADLDRADQRRLVLEGVSSIRKRFAEMRRQNSRKGGGPGREAREEAEGRDGGSSESGLQGDHEPPLTLAVIAIDASSDEDRENGAGEGADAESSAPRREPIESEATGDPCGASRSKEPARVDRREVGEPAPADGVASPSSSMGKETTEVGGTLRPHPGRRVVLPLAKNLADPTRIEIEAWMCSVLWPAIECIRNAAAEDQAIAQVLDPERQADGSFARTIARLLQTPHSDHWVACPACGGDGDEGIAICGDCDGRGYVYRRRVLV